VKREELILDVAKDMDMDLLVRARQTFFPESDQAALRYVDWSYRNNPAGPVYACLILEGETVAGQYVNIPISVILHGKTQKASYSLDTFVHPDYRRQGIFVRLAETLFRHIADEGCLFTIGMPNRLSRPGFLGSLGFVEPFGVYSFLRPLSLALGSGQLSRGILTGVPFGGIKRLIRRMRVLEFNRTEGPDDQWVDTLWQSCLPHIVLDLNKDARWVRWRYTENPRARYDFLTATERDGRPVGYVVWQHERHVFKRFERYFERGLSYLYLMDVVAEDLLTALCLVWTFINEIAKDHNFVRVTAPARGRLAYVLFSSGFFPVRRVSFIYRAHHQFVPAAGDLKGSKWPVTTCYWDVM